MEKEKKENYTDATFEESIKSLKPETQAYMRRYYHMTDDEIIDMFLPMNFNYEPNVDDEYKFKETIQLLKFDRLAYLLESEGLYTITKKDNLTSYDHTYKAKEVMRAGGWLKWLKDISDAKERQVALERTTIKLNRNQNINIVLTLLIISGTLFVTWLNYTVTVNNLTKTDYRDSIYITQQKALQDKVNELSYRINSIINDTTKVK